VTSSDFESFDLPQRGNLLQTEPFPNAVKVTAREKRVGTVADFDVFYMPFPRSELATIQTTVS
jgi:hypothetical protein